MGRGAGVCNRADEGGTRVKESSQLFCLNCGSEDFTSNKVLVCHRDFKGLVCQTCGYVLTQKDIDAGLCWRYEKAISEVIDEVNQEIAQKRKNQPLLARIFKPPIRFR